MHDPHDELTAAEAEALAQLPGREEPPSWLEEKIVDELKRAGLVIAARRRPGRKWAAAAAAAVAIFMAGLLAGIYMPGGMPGDDAPALSQVAAPEGRKFVLFLYEDETYEAPAIEALDDRVEEYRRWGQALARGGHLVDGAKLKDAFEMLPAGSVAPGEGLGLLAGYFVLVARDDREALDLAAGCPHLKYRGRILVREIDPV